MPILTQIHRKNIGKISSTVTIFKVTASLLEELGKTLLRVFDFLFTEYISVPRFGNTVYNYNSMTLKINAKGIK